MKEDVLAAVGIHRVNQLDIESELVFGGVVPRHPTQIGISDSDRELLVQLLEELELEGKIVSFGKLRKSYKVVEV